MVFLYRKIWALLILHLKFFFYLDNILKELVGCQEMTRKLLSQVKEQQLTFLRNLKGTVFSMVVITLDLPGRLFNSQRRH